MMLFLVIILMTMIILRNKLKMHIIVKPVIVYFCNIIQNKLYVYYNVHLDNKYKLRKKTNLGLRLLIV